MPPKPNARNWNDVQTAIATAAIVTTLGMWNIFASPAKAKETEPAQPDEEAPVLPDMPSRGPNRESSGVPVPTPTSMPYVKIMFSQAVITEPATTNVQQPQAQNQTKKKKKKNKDKGGDGGGGGGGGGQPVTQTQSS
jgi:hypothetical protein